MAVGTTRSKRRLGRFIRPILERSGLKPDEVAERTVCEVQTITRMLAGRSLPGRQRFVTVLAVINATDEEREKALQLYQMASMDAAVIEQADAPSAKYRRFRMDEAEAAEERSLDTVILSGLLQTPEYATALARGRRRLLRSADWEQRAGGERRDRQALLHREKDPLNLHALIHEAALRTVIGGPKVMIAQLDHLLAIGKLPNVTLQVVPSGFGAHGAMTGPWYLLGFAEPDEPDLAFAESIAGMDTIENPDDVSALTDIWWAIAKAAPSPTRSTEIIKKVRDEMKGR